MTEKNEKNLYGFRWDGAVMIPLLGGWERCKSNFKVSGVYSFEWLREHSKRNRDQFFSRLHDMFENIPEILEREWGNEEQFRKWMLIEAGYYHEERWIFISPEEAFRFAVDRKASEHQPYARIEVMGNIVSVRTAKSQSEQAMGHDEFTQSKQKVFDIYHKLTGIDPMELGKAA